SQHSISAVDQDQGETTDSAVQAARTLVDHDNASCLIGPWSADGVAQTAQDVAIPAKVLQISPVPTSDDVAELSDHDLVDSTPLPQSGDGPAIPNAIDDDLGGTKGKTVNVAANHGTYGDTVSQDFTQSWQGNEGTVGEQVVLSAPPTLGTTSTSGYSSTTAYGSSG